MKFVIYDDATLEPITVVNIRGFTEQDIEAHGCRYRLVLPPAVGTYQVSEKMPIEELMRIVDLHFEPLIRARRNGADSALRSRRSWSCC